ncbi:DUF4150 domain-containing protein [Ideonella azotifigens]|uniref:Tox-PAAR-like domain-containing protein n=1 Tax=Ideonella azotifigens TaxID=513160 RepID=A0ABP3VCB0_9BURK|nr:DUF4150 domain-containing protein [Ideonella azotifigens]MCD2344352.1 DUF4150 domain-containing protein [Ideonella azotifigens]
MATVKVNGTLNALVHKGGSWMSIATVPDVCKTPTPGGPVPMPYPNISQSSTLSDGTTTVKVDGGNMAAIKGSKFSMSSGDEPGTVGGVKSNTFKQASTWILYSFDVKLDGQNACRFSDKKLQNNENTVDAAGTIPLVTPIIDGLDEVEMKCGEINQYGEQKKKTAKGKRARDHIPSKAALKERAKELKAQAAKSKRKKVPLSKCERKVIDDSALTIVIPTRAHQRASPSYGQSRVQASRDAQNLQGAAKGDTAAMMSDKDGIKKYDAACQEAYKQNAEKINNITNEQYDSWLKKCLDACKA